MSSKSYSDLKRFYTFDERFDYLKLGGEVGKATFGFDRWINQAFYRSTQWKHVRNDVIARDEGCDLGIDGYEIFGDLYIHHMNPMSAQDIESGNPDILDPEYLITVTHQTHNAIHFGDRKLLNRTPVERRPGDTKMW